MLPCKNVAAVCIIDDAMSGDGHALVNAGMDWIGFACGTLRLNAGWGRLFGISALSPKTWRYPEHFDDQSEWQFCIDHHFMGATLWETGSHTQIEPNSID